MSGLCENPEYPIPNYFDYAVYPSGIYDIHMFSMTATNSLPTTRGYLCSEARNFKRLSMPFNALVSEVKGSRLGDAQLLVSNFSSLFDLTRQLSPIAKTSITKKSVKDGQQKENVSETQNGCMFTARRVVASAQPVSIH